MSARDNIAFCLAIPRAQPLGAIKDALKEFRAEVLREAAAALDGIADETESHVADYYGKASGIGPGSAEMVREAARSVRSMAVESGEDVREPTQTADPDACTCMPHRRFDCGHCDMDRCCDCGQCPCGCDCNGGGDV